MKLYLFGHGMMLFWYRRRTSESIDGYRILIPQCPIHLGVQQHELRLVTEPGGTNSPVIKYSPHPEPTKFYELQFGAATSVKPRGPKDCTANIGLYEVYGRCKAEPNYGYERAGGVAFAIDIPYPEKDDQLRPQPFRAPAYLAGYTREDFQIYPCEIPRSNLFTYEIKNSNIPVVLQNKLDPSDCSVVTTFSKGDVKLYLYSGPAHVRPDATHPQMTHLPVFNKMLRYDHHSELDLALNPHSHPVCVPLQADTIPAEFSVQDFQHLAEFNDQIDFCDLAEAGANPAECSQGGGC